MEAYLPNKPLRS